MPHDVAVVPEMAIRSDDPNGNFHVGVGLLLGLFGVDLEANGDDDDSAVDKGIFVLTKGMPKKSKRKRWGFFTG